MLKIAHIINPVKTDRSSDLFLAQLITFEAVRVAQDLAKSKVEINLFTAQYPEDHEIIPHIFKKTENLERSILDMGNFKKKRKLPLLKDILDRLYRESDADVFVFSNVDIALQPYFYLSISQIIEMGFDAFVVNRRIIPDKYDSESDLPLMYSEIGESHFGHDCFIFKRNDYPQFMLGNVCVGIRLVGRVLLWNLLAFASRFKEFKDLHLTFHLGKETNWKNPDMADYDQHNHKEALKILYSLDEQFEFLNLLKRSYPKYLIGIDLNQTIQSQDE